VKRRSRYRPAKTDRIAHPVKNDGMPANTTNQTLLAASCQFKMTLAEKSAKVSPKTDDPSQKQTLPNRASM
jgi:hypothetical protein